MSQEKYQEIANRGLQDQLDPDKRARFDEAVKRGLIILPEPQAAPQESMMDLIGGGASMVNRGLTFGLSDEMAGIMGAVNPMEMGEGYLTDMGDRYTQSRDEARALQSGFQQQHPMAAPLLETAGAMGTGFAATPKLMSMTGAGALSPLSREGLTKSAQIGALEGTTYGYGVGEGEGDTLSKMAEYGVLGGTLNPLMDVGMAGFAATGSALKNRFRMTPEQKARNAVSAALDADDLSLEQAAIDLEGLGPEGILADVGPNVRATADVVASNVGQAKKRANAILDSRQMGQQKRIMSAAEGALGADPDEFMGTVREMSQQRFERAQPLYEEAKNVPITVNDDLSKLFDRPSVKKAMGDVETIAKEEGIDITGFDIDNPSMDQLDTLKKALDRQIGTLKRSGDDNWRRVNKTKNELLTLIDEQNPAYKQARNMWESDTKSIEAADLGRRILKDDAEETAEIVSQMTQTEKDSYVLGAVKAVQDAIEGVADTHNAARKIVATPKLRNRLRNAFDSDEAFNEFMDRMDTEAVFTATRSGIGKGSQTAQRQMAEKTLGIASEGEGILPMIMSGLRMNYGQAAEQGARNILRGGSLDPAIGDEAASLLLDPSLTRQELMRRLGTQNRRYSPTISPAGAMSGATYGVLAGQ